MSGTMPDQMWTTYKNHDDPVWGDNDIEFFINDPILGETYFQICVNAAGTICDGSVTPGAAFKSTYESNAEVKTSIGPDRWFVEMRIPTQSITGRTLSAEIC